MKSFMLFTAMVLSVPMAMAAQPGPIQRFAQNLVKPLKIERLPPVEAAPMPAEAAPMEVDVDMPAAEKAELDKLKAKNVSRLRILDGNPLRDEVAMRPHHHATAPTVTDTTPEWVPWAVGAGCIFMCVLMTILYCNHHRAG